MENIKGNDGHFMLQVQTDHKLIGAIIITLLRKYYDATGYVISKFTKHI